MTKAAAQVIDAFAELVARAEATADTRPKAELACFQLQGLTGTLRSLSDADLPDDVEEALSLLREHVASLGGGVDRTAGDEMREKVQAYRVLADDLDLDGPRLDDLLARWDAVTATTSSPRRGANASAAAETACPVCGGYFKRVNKHLSAAHPDEWARRKG